MYFYLLLYASPLFDSSLYFLFVKLVTGFIHSSPKFVKHLYDCYLELYWEDCLSPLHLVLLLGFYLVPRFGTYSAVASFCLILCFYFYVFGRLVTLHNLGEVAYVEDILWGPSMHSPLVTRAICTKSAL